LKSRVALLALAAGSLSLSAQTSVSPNILAPEPGESHLRNVRQLTNGGENAEAYFSHDGKRLIFQSTRDGRTCDQQYLMNIDGSHVVRVSNGVGKTTCGYFLNGDRRVLFASIHALERIVHPVRIRPKGTSGASILTTSTRPAQTGLTCGASPDLACTQLRVSYLPMDENWYSRRSRMATWIST